MQSVGQVGASITIKGDLKAQEDVSIAGRFEGKITVSGHRVTVEPGAVVAADISAAEVIIAGKVRGTVVADRRIELTSAAEVKGALHAPALALTDGAVFQGKAETKQAHPRGLQLAS